MNIALLHYSAPPIIGGVEGVLGEHARLMRRAGHHVRIVAGRGKTLQSDIPVHVLPRIDSRHPEVEAAKHSLDQGQVPPNFTPLVDAIKDDLRIALIGANVVIAHNVASLHKNLALTAALYDLSQQPNAPRLLLWHHDLAWTTPRYRAELHDGWPWDLLRTAWPGAVQVVISDLRCHELAQLMRLPPETIPIVPNGVDLPIFLHHQPLTTHLIQQTNLLQAAPILLMPVRLTRRKHIEMAVDILAALRRHLPDAALIVTGPPGPHNPANAAYLRRLREQRASLGLAQSVHFLADFQPDGLPDAVVHDFYRVADGLLMTSQEEGFGIPILEAGLAGLPIFCTNIPPLRALVGAEATLFETDADPAAVAERIAQRLGPDPVYRMRVRVRHEYAWQAIYKRHIAPLLD